MTTAECTREQDVLDALTSAQWPEHVSADLRRHVAECHLCTDLVEVAGPLLNERGRISDDAHIPSSAVMWWRAQMRARQEAAREAARPITVAQTIAGTVAIVLAAAVLVAIAPWIWPHIWLGSAGLLSRFDWAGLFAPAVLDGQGSIVPMFVIGVAGLLLLLVMPLAFYFAVRDRDKEA